MQTIQSCDSVGFNAYSM